jgi:hypothetical protein
MLRQTSQCRFLAGESNRSSSRDPRTARKIGNQMLWQLGAGADETHMPGEHIQYLRQLVELPSAQERTDRSKPLVDRSRNCVMCFVWYMGHGSEFQNRESLAVTPDAALHEQDRPA